MTTEDIVGAILRAASALKKPVAEVAAQGIKDLYAAAKERLKRKIDGNADARDALESATAKPESDARKAVLLEELAAVNVADDLELLHLVQHLSRVVPAELASIHQNVRVIGRGHRVQVAARDIISADKVVVKNAVTPDDRHLSGEEKNRLQPLIDDLAARLAGEDGKPNYKKVHAMLQRKFGVTSYLLVKRTDFEAAVTFLRQQRAMNRPRLRRRNPEAYDNDFFRAIWSRARELGWDKPCVYAFAGERLVLKKPISSLKLLGSLQLKKLAEAMQGEVRKHREQTPGASADGASA